MKIYKIIALDQKQEQVSALGWRPFLTSKIATIANRIDIVREVAGDPLGHFIDLIADQVRLDIPGFDVKTQFKQVAEKAITQCLGFEKSQLNVQDYLPTTYHAQPNHIGIRFKFGGSMPDLCIHIWDEKDGMRIGFGSPIGTDDFKLTLHEIGDKLNSVLGKDNLPDQISKLLSGETAKQVAITDFVFSINQKGLPSIDLGISYDASIGINVGPTKITFSNFRMFLGCHIYSDGLVLSGEIRLNVGDFELCGKVPGGGMPWEFEAFAHWVEPLSVEKLLNNVFGGKLPEWLKGHCPSIEDVQMHMVPSQGAFSLTVSNSNEEHPWRLITGTDDKGKEVPYVQLTAYAFTVSRNSSGIQVGFDAKFDFGGIKFPLSLGNGAVNEPIRLAFIDDKPYPLSTLVDAKFPGGYSLKGTYVGQMIRHVNPVITKLALSIEGKTVEGFELGFFTDPISMFDGKLVITGPPAEDVVSVPNQAKASVENVHPQAVKVSGPRLDLELKHPFNSTLRDVTCNVHAGLSLFGHPLSLSGEYVNDHDKAPSFVLNLASAKDIEFTPNQVLQAMVNASLPVIGGYDLGNTTVVLAGASLTWDVIQKYLEVASTINGVNARLVLFKPESGGGMGVFFEVYIEDIGKVVPALQSLKDSFPVEIGFRYGNRDFVPLNIKKGPTLRASLSLTGGSNRFLSLVHTVTGYERLSADLTHNDNGWQLSVPLENPDEINLGVVKIRDYNFGLNLEQLSVNLSATLADMLIMGVKLEIVVSIAIKMGAFNASIEAKIPDGIKMGPIYMTGLGFNIMGQPPKIMIGLQSKFTLKPVKQCEEKDKGDINVMVSPVGLPASLLASTFTAKLPEGMEFSVNGLLQLIDPTCSVPPWLDPVKISGYYPITVVTKQAFEGIAYDDTSSKKLKSWVDADPQRLIGKTILFDNKHWTVENVQVGKETESQDIIIQEDKTPQAKSITRRMNVTEITITLKEKDPEKTSSPHDTSSQKGSAGKDRTQPDIRVITLLKRTCDNTDTDYVFPPAPETNKEQSGVESKTQVSDSQAAAADDQSSKTKGIQLTNFAVIVPPKIVTEDESKGIWEKVNEAGILHNGEVASIKKAELTQWQIELQVVEKLNLLIMALDKPRDAAPEFEVDEEYVAGYRESKQQEFEKIAGLFKPMPAEYAALFTPLTDASIEPSIPAVNARIQNALLKVEENLGNHAQFDLDKRTYPEFDPKAATPHIVERLATAAKDGVYNCMEIRFVPSALDFALVAQVDLFDGEVLAQVYAAVSVSQGLALKGVMRPIRKTGIIEITDFEGIGGPRLDVAVNPTDITNAHFKFTGYVNILDTVKGGAEIKLDKKGLFLRAELKVDSKALNVNSKLDVSISKAGLLFATHVVIDVDLNKADLGPVNFIKQVAPIIYLNVDMNGQATEHSQQFTFKAEAQIGELKLAFNFHVSNKMALKDMLQKLMLDVPAQLIANAAAITEYFTEKLKSEFKDLATNAEAEFKHVAGDALHGLLDWTGANKELKADIDKNRQGIEKNRQAIDKLRAKIANNAKDIAKNKFAIAKANADIEYNGRRIDELEAKLEEGRKKLEKRIAKAEVKLNKKIEANSKAIQDLGNELKNLERHIDQKLQLVQVAINEQMNALKTDIYKVKRRVDKVEFSAKLDALAPAINQVEAMLAYFGTIFSSQDFNQLSAVTSVQLLGHLKTIIEIATGKYSDGSIFDMWINVYLTPITSNHIEPAKEKGVVLYTSRGKQESVTFDGTSKPKMTAQVEAARQEYINFCLNLIRVVQSGIAMIFALNPLLIQQLSSQYPDFFKYDDEAIDINGNVTQALMRVTQADPKFADMERQMAAQLKVTLMAGIESYIRLIESARRNRFFDMQCMTASADGSKCLESGFAGVIHNHKNPETKSTTTKLIFLDGMTFTSETESNQ